MAYPKASTSIHSLWSALGIARMGVDAINFFSFLKTLLSSVPHFHSLFPVSSVRFADLGKPPNKASVEVAKA